MGVNITFDCTIEKEATVHLINAIHPFRTNKKIKLDQTSTAFDLEMTLVDENSTTLPVDAEIIIPQKINILLETNDIDAEGDFKLKIEKCWATPSQNMEDEIQYSFFAEFCPMNNVNQEGNGNKVKLIIPFNTIYF